MYRLLHGFLTILELTLPYVNTLNVCHDALQDVIAIDGWLQTGRVHVQVHVLNLNNQYPSLF